MLNMRWILRVAFFGSVPAFFFSSYTATTAPKTVENILKQFRTTKYQFEYFSVNERKVFFSALVLAAFVGPLAI